jgi:transposase InsO family protein
VPALRACFPALGRAELADLLRRYRRVWRARHRVPLRVLRWSAPVRVWAVDFTGPLPGVEGGRRYVLAVRDLASGRQLLWRPAEAATGDVARGALAGEQARHGAPLVLKSDNGPPFTAAAVREELAGHGVVGLYSPPHWPRYNGAIEAGIGSLRAGPRRGRRGPVGRARGRGTTWKARGRRPTPRRARGSRAA